MKKALLVTTLVFAGGRLSSADFIVSVAEFQVIGYDGTDQASMLTAFTFADSGKNYLSRCKGSICRGIPFGSYKYQLRLIAYPKATPIEGRALIGYPQNLITVRTPPPGDQAGVSIPGQVRGVTASNRMWVRAKAIFFDYTLDARVRPDGRFDLHGMVGGKYMIWILENGKVLGYQRWDCCNGMRVDGEMYVLDAEGKMIMGPRGRLIFGKMYLPAW